jgi:hypothetical protein
MSGTPLITIVTTSHGEGALGSVRESPVAVLYKRIHFVSFVSVIAWALSGNPRWRFCTKGYISFSPFPSSRLTRRHMGTLMRLAGDGRGRRQQVLRPPALSVGLDMLNSDDIEFVAGHLLANTD